MLMKTYKITPKELKTMNISEFQTITEKYEDIEWIHSKSSLCHYFIKEKKSISHFEKKLDLFISYHVKKREWELHDVLVYLMDDACFLLDLEVVQYLLQKGCKVNKKDYESAFESPLFRTFFYNYYVLNMKKMNTLRRKNLEEIGKMLIRYGSLLEINVEEFGTTKKVNVIEMTKKENTEQFLSYMENCRPLFNPMQQKQWGAIKLSMLF